MIVDRLVLHHTYEGATAFDVSQHHHHGVLEHVGSGGGTVTFSGGPDCVRVAASAELRSLRAVRTTVRFRWDPTGSRRRHNLIEGYLSFALVIEADGSLVGTILDRSGTWAGTRSGPGVVQQGAWHTATFVHDGMSACRIDLDGTTIAEAYDVLGPVSGVQPPYGLAIGHWPDPDDRYTLEGDIDDVRLWVDRLEPPEWADPCCCDGGARADQAFARLRAELDVAAHRNAAETLHDLGVRVFGQMASGTQADRDRAHDLARRFALAVALRDRQSLGTTIADATQLAQSKIAASDLDDAGVTLKAALDQTLIGPVLEQALGGGQGATPQELERLLGKLGIDEWIRGFCFGWAMPPERPPEGKRKPERRPPPRREEEPGRRDTVPVDAGDPAEGGEHDR